MSGPAGGVLQRPAEVEEELVAAPPADQLHADRKPTGAASHRGDQLYREAERVGRDLGWATTNDAEYVALARMEGTRLVTQDARLQRGAGRVVDIVGIDDVVG